MATCVNIVHFVGPKKLYQGCKPKPKAHKDKAQSKYYNPYVKVQQDDQQMGPTHVTKTAELVAT